MVQHTQIAKSRTTPTRHRRRALAAALLLLATAPATHASSFISWVAGSATWTDGTGGSNWSPATEPGPTDFVTIGVSNAVLTMGSANSIATLDMFNNATLLTNGFNLNISGNSTFNGGVTGMTIAAGSTVTSADIVLGTSSGGQLTMNGGTLICVDPTANTGQLINLHGTVSGYGTLNFTETPAATTTLFENDSTLTATSAFGIFVGPQPTGTLIIKSLSSNARVDLDGTLSTETGTVNVQQNQTLDIRVALTDAFSSAMTLGRNSTLSMTSPWSIDTGGTLTVTNGATGSFPFNLPADVAYISGAAFTLANGTITVATTDSTLQFNAPFTLSSGTFTNNGLVVFNANATINSSSSFTMPSNSSSLTLNAGVTVTVNQANFNPDGTGSFSNVITLNSGSTLALNLGGGADEDFNNTLLLNGGTLAVTTLDNTWSIQSTLTVAANTGTSTLAGEELTFASGAVVTVGTNSILNVTAPAVLAGGSYTGAGTFRLSGNATVSANTTIDVNTFDPDGTAFVSSLTIAAGATLTINSPNFDTDGDMDNPISIGGASASLIVNGPASWTMRNTLNTNTSGTGTATIGGTSRLILAAAHLNALAPTIISAPVTFGPSSTVTVSANSTLTLSNDAIYDSTTVTGTGQYNPGPTNTIASNTLINVAKFYFSRGNWTVNPGATFTVNVADYDPNFATSKSFDSSITLNSSTLSVTDSALDVFIINGSLNLNNTTGTVPTLTGEDVQVGNDSGPQTANVAVAGTGLSIITPDVTFTSDSHLTVAANASLVLTGLANFYPANGASNGSFSGAGTLILENGAIFNELTTLNFTTGTVDLDGRATDITGNIIDVDAPLTINAATLSSFGKSNLAGTNTLTVDHTGTGTGLLTVNLDNPADHWTVNAPGVLNLANANSPAQTLLAGSPLTLLGTLNVTGDTRTTARLDIGATGIVNLNSNSIPFHLAGGSLANPNTIAGGTINGLGILAADSGIALRGFGTIANITNIDFDGTAELRAQGGTLVVNSAILDVGIAGTADATGTLQLTNPQTLDNTMTVELLGGSVTGSALTNNGIIRGTGIVANTIVNNNIAGTLRGVPAGTLLFTGIVGLSNGTIDLNSGTVQFSKALTNSSTGLIKGPGTLKADADLINNGVIQAPAGITNFFGAITNTAGSSLMVQANATTTFNNNVIVNTGAALTAAAGSTNKFLASLLVNGTVTLAPNVTATSIANLNIPAGGLFDASNDKLIIDYTGASPIDNIRAYLLAGRLFSSTANADPQNRLTIGYIEASLLGVSTWSTLPVDTTAVLTKLTYFGDANLDGKVDADDYALLDRGFAKGLTGWSNGDFDHSGSITSADFLLIDRVVTQQGAPLTPDFLATRESQFGAAYVTSLIASVPEPTSLLAAGGLAFPLLTRRRPNR